MFKYGFSGEDNIPIRVKYKYEMFVKEARKEI